MPTSLTFAQHLAVLSAAGPRLAALAADAGPTAPVPTCPAWDANALLAHQAMVHRWATAIVTGTDPDDVPTQTELRSHADLAAYYREGLAALVDALSTAPEDLDVMTFLKDPPAPRHFWARRQAHEIRSLQDRLRQRPIVVRAVLKLMAEGRMDDTAALKQLRALAMDWRLTIEQAAECICENQPRADRSA